MMKKNQLTFRELVQFCVDLRQPQSVRRKCSSSVTRKASRPKLPSKISWSGNEKIARKNVDRKKYFFDYILFYCLVNTHNYRVCEITDYSIWLLIKQKKNGKIKIQLIGIAIRLQCIWILNAIISRANYC